MSWGSKRGVGAIFVVAGLAAGAIGCGGASEASHYIDGQDLMISWDGGGAGLYVTETKATAPDGPGQKVTGGKTFWGIEATSWPGGFESPVRYRNIPSDAEDVTAENGGPAGGIPLEKGLTYKITIQGFGGDPVVQEITW